MQADGFVESRITGLHGGRIDHDVRIVDDLRRDAGLWKRKPSPCKRRTSAVSTLSEPLTRCPSASKARPNRSCRNPRRRSGGCGGGTGGDDGRIKSHVVHGRHCRSMVSTSREAASSGASWRASAAMLASFDGALMISRDDLGQKIAGRLVFFQRNRRTFARVKILAFSVW